MPDIKKVLCVIHHKDLRKALESRIKEELGEKVSQIELDFAQDYHKAVSKLKNNYEFYILNDLLPKKEGEEKQFFYDIKNKIPFSFKLIEQIYEKEKGLKKIIFISSFDDMLEGVKKMGIKKLYHRWYSTSSYNKDIEDLAKDLKGFLVV